MNNLNIAVVSSYIPIRYVGEILKDSFLEHEELQFTSERNKFITKVKNQYSEECRNTYYLMSAVNREGLSDSDLKHLDTFGIEFDQIIFIGSFNKQIYNRLLKFINNSQVPKESPNEYDRHFRVQKLMLSDKWRIKGYEMGWNNN